VAIEVINQFRIQLFRLPWCSMPAPRSRNLEGTDLAAWRGFLQASRLITDALDADLRAGHGRTLSDYEVLLLLHEAEGQRLRMSELAERALVTRSRLTHTVDRLEADGLVRRRPVADDRRGAYAELTRPGVAALRAMAPTHLAGIRRDFLDHLSPADAEVLADVFERLVRARL
jgi:DNA-binding MarR family transcriptional regulator